MVREMRIKFEENLTKLIPTTVATHRPKKIEIEIEKRRRNRNCPQSTQRTPNQQEWHL